MLLILIALYINFHLIADCTHQTYSISIYICGSKIVCICWYWNLIIIMLAVVMLKSNNFLHAIYIE